MKRRQRSNHVEADSLKRQIPVVEAVKRKALGGTELEPTQPDAEGVSLLYETGHQTRLSSRDERAFKRIGRQYVVGLRYRKDIESVQNQRSNRIRELARKVGAHCGILSPPDNSRLVVGTETSIIYNDTLPEALGTNFSTAASMKFTATFNIPVGSDPEHGPYTAEQLAAMIRIGSFAIGFPGKNVTFKTEYSAVPSELHRLITGGQVDSDAINAAGTATELLRIQTRPIIDLPPTND